MAKPKGASSILTVKHSKAAIDTRNQIAKGSASLELPNPNTETVPSSRIENRRVMKKPSIGLVSKRTDEHKRQPAQRSKLIYNQREKRQNALENNMKNISLKYNDLRKGKMKGRTPKMGDYAV